MNERIIHTKLYSKIAKEVLQSVEGQMSDGLWENSPAMEKYWLFSSIDTAPNGEVLIKVSTNRYDTKWHGNGRAVVNGLIDMSDTEIIKWFAAKVKHIMQTELKDEKVFDGWKRDNDMFKTQYLSYKETITVRDVYFIYDFLLGHDTTRKYGVMAITSIIGMSKSKSDTMKEENRRSKIAKLEAKWLKTHDKLLAKRDAAIEKIKDEYRTEHSKLWNEFVFAKEAIKGM